MAAIILMGMSYTILNAQRKQRTSASDSNLTASNNVIISWMRFEGFNSHSLNGESLFKLYKINLELRKHIPIMEGKQH